MTDTDWCSRQWSRFGTDNETTDNLLGHNTGAREKPTVLLGQQRWVCALCADQSTSEAFQFPVFRLQCRFEFTRRSVFDDMIIGNLSNRNLVFNRERKYSKAKHSNLQQSRSNLGAILLPQRILTDLPGNRSDPTRQRSPLLVGHILNRFLCHGILVGRHPLNDGRHTVFIVDHFLDEALVLAGYQVVVDLNRNQIHTFSIRIIVN